MNLNTPDFWDKEFEKEYELLKTQKYAHYDKGYRWDGVKFTIIGALIPLRGKLVDIGCGLGNFCRYMKARNPGLEVYGTDFSPKGIELAKEIEPRISYTVADAYNLPFPDDYFDAVSAQEIIEHLEDPNKATQEWKRVLKKGGRLFITTPWRGVRKCHLGPKFRGLTSKEHLFEWTPKEFASFCSKHFGENAKILFPPAITDVRTQKTELFFWIMAICEK